MKKVTCHDIYGNLYEVDPEQLTFRPSVYGILIENGKILLSKQGDGYEFPGGGVEINETVEEALKREFIEETGIEVVLDKPIHIETSFFAPKHDEKLKDQYWSATLIYFLVKKVGGKLSIDNLEESEKSYVNLPEWIDLGKVKKLKFYNSVDSPAVIKKALINEN